MRRHNNNQLLTRILYCSMLRPLGGGHRYSWILLDTGFFGYLANFWDPSIQVSKKKHVFTPNFLTLGTHRGRGLGLNSLLL